MTVRAAPHSPPRAHTAPQHPPQVSVKREDVHKAIAHLPPEKQKWANGILNSTNGPGGKSVNVTPHQLKHFLNGLDPNEKSQFLKMAGNSRVSERIDPSRISVVEERSHAAPNPASQAQTRPTKAENIPVNLHANGNESNGSGNKPQPPTLTGKPQAQIQGVQTPPSSPGAQAPAATQSTQANHPSDSAGHNQASAATHPESKPSIGEQFLSKMGFSSKIVAGIAAIAVGIPLLSFLFAKTSPSDTSAGTPQPVG